MNETVFLDRNAGAVGTGPNEPFSRRWASAALPIASAALVLSLSAVKGGSGVASSVPARFAGLDVGETGLAAIFAAGLALVALLGVLASPGAGKAVRYLRRGGFQGALGFHRQHAAIRLSAPLARARDVEEPWEVRSALFALMARTAAARADKNDIDRLADRAARAMAAGIEASGDLAALDHGLAEVCGNRTACDLFGQVDRRVRAPGSAGMSPAEWRQTLLAWRGMIEALRSRDPATAETIARRLSRLREPAGGRLSSR